MLCKKESGEKTLKVSFRVYPISKLTTIQPIVSTHSLRDSF